MRRDHLHACAVVVSLLAGVSLAAAQQPSPTADPQQQSQQEKAQQTPSGQMGKEEPSSHAPAAKPQDSAALVNGALAVPGAPASTDTVPAKFSEKNAADDKLITVAYTFKTLTPDQRRAIHQGLKDQPPANPFNASIGTELPLAIELRAVPDEVASRVPQAKGYQYVVAGSEVMLVSPPTRIVVGLFSDAR
jgi:hypothetical protein